MGGVKKRIKSENGSIREMGVLNWLGDRMEVSV